MGLFDKKYCDVCSDKIGLMGNRKLEDGNLCKNCASLLSPFMTDRRRTTVAEVKDHLAYREANKAVVAAFNLTRTIGTGTKVLLDEGARKFIVSSSSRWQSENPDVIDFSQVTGCNTEIRESRTEIKREGKDGSKSSYNPPRYDIDYDFYLTININSPWFSDINFKVNGSRVEERTSVQYREADRQSQEIKEALTSVQQDVRAAAAPKTARNCPLCGASCIPDASGCCEYCGGAMGA